MKRVQFSEDIDAPKAQVWAALWENANYREWTRVFGEGSYMSGDLKEGNEVHFGADDGGGMYSRIERMVENEKMYFTHIGALENGQPMPAEKDEAHKKYSGAVENYTLQELDEGRTRVIVDMDIDSEHEESFAQKFPVALAKVKELAERKG